MAFKIYTKTGDKGSTSLFGGTKRLKSNARIEAYGTIDELNAHIGLLRDELSLDKKRDELYHIQNRLFDIGASLASDPQKNPLPSYLEGGDIIALEQSIDQMTEAVPPLRQFVLPGGHKLVSYAHVARTVARRAERRTVALGQNEAIDDKIIPYLNRLSDYLFALGRYIAHTLQVEEIKWQSRNTK